MGTSHGPHGLRGALMRATGWMIEPAASHPGKETGGIGRCGGGGVVGVVGVLLLRCRGGGERRRRQSRESSGGGGGGRSLVLSGG